MNNKFFNIISGIFPQEIKDMLSIGKPISISIKGNCVEGKHFIILDNGTLKYSLETPDLCQLSGSCIATVQKAVWNQKNIDLWVNSLAENIQFIVNLFYCKNIEIKILDTFIYKNHMFSVGWSQFDEENTYIIHPYLAQKYSIDEIKQLIHEQTHNNNEVHIKVDLWNGANYFTFKQFNVDYLQLEDGD